MKKLLIVLAIVAIVLVGCVYNDDNWCGVPDGVTDATCNDTPPNVPLMPTATQYFAVPPDCDYCTP